MNSRIRFSIITVCKDSQKTIENAILSVLIQSYTDYEYIIVDGVSRDKTLDIVNKYSDRITKIISEPDNGLYDAMNKGIKNAAGDYVFFLNSDDRFLHENVLQHVAKKAQNTENELLYGDQVFVNSQTNTTSIRKHNKLNKIYLLKNTPCQPATFYRRDVFAKYGDFDTEFKIVSDHEWFLRAFLKHKISYLYLGFPVTVFNSGGLSTSPSAEEKLNNERNLMFEKYFSASERQRLEFLSKYLRCFTTMPVAKDILDLLFRFEL